MLTFYGQSSMIVSASEIKFCKKSSFLIIIFHIMSLV